MTIIEDATRALIRAQTNDSGSFTRPLLKPGTYTVTVDAAGFQKAEQKGIIVNPGEPVAANITMKVGNASQTIEVTAAAPLLQTETAPRVRT